MAIYLDTSALVKLFIDETTRPPVVDAVRGAPPLVIGWLSLVEFRSAIYRKVQSGEMTAGDATRVFSDFVQAPRQPAVIVPYQESILQRASTLIDSHGTNGLRTLDALQISTALESGNTLFGTSDRPQADFAKSAGLEVRIF